MPEPTVLTVILNYRTPAMTLEAVEAALREMADIAGEIVVVDNDSGDGSFETISAARRRRRLGRGPRPRRRRRPQRRLRRRQQRRHPRRAERRRPPGLRLHPELRRLPGRRRDPPAGGLSRGHPDVGFAGSYIHGPDGEPHATAFRFPTLWSEFEGAARVGPISRLLARHVVPLPIPEARRPVDWLAGASVMMRRTMLDAIGLFDEGFFLYFDETDLCRRGRTAGWPTVYVRESEVAHIGSVSTGMKAWARTPTYWFDSRLRYFVKHHGVAYAAAATVALVAGGLIWRARMVAPGPAARRPAALPARPRRPCLPCLHAPRPAPADGAGGEAQQSAA